MFININEFNELDNLYYNAYYYYFNNNSGFSFNSKTAEDKLKQFYNKLDKLNIKGDNRINIIEFFINNYDKKRGVNNDENEK